MSDLPTPVPGQPRLLPPPRLIIRYHLHSGNWNPSFVFVNLVPLWLYTSHNRQCTWGLSQSLPESCLLFCCSKYEPLKCKIITQPRHSKKRNVDRMILGENKTALKVARKRQKMKIRTYLLLYWKPESWRPWRLCHQTSSFRISCYSSFMFLSFFILSFYENIRKYLLTINNIIITLTCTNDVNF